MTYTKNNQHTSGDIAAASSRPLARLVAMFGLLVGLIGSAFLVPSAAEASPHATVMAGVIELHGFSSIPCSSYEWSQVSGPASTIADRHAANTTATIGGPGTYSYQLECGGLLGGSSFFPVSIRIEPIVVSDGNHFVNPPKFPPGCGECVVFFDHEPQEPVFDLHHFGAEVVIEDWASFADMTRALLDGVTHGDPTPDPNALLDDLLDPTPTPMLGAAELGIPSAVASVDLDAGIGVVILLRELEIEIG